jgi:curli biogenesis system outer membrane secretion channel CsgG
MNNFIKISFISLFSLAFITGCAQKVHVRALNPAEVSEMATKKKVAVSQFRHDYIGLSGKIEAEIARQRIDKKRYFTLLSRKDMSKILKEQKLQSSELIDEKTTARVGKLIGAQAIISGDIGSANAESSHYYEDRQSCIKYDKEKKECTRYRYYRVRCNTTQASVSASINIVDVENGTVIYGDTLSREYSADSCRYGSSRVLSKGQALNRLTSSIARDFVHKLTPNYIYFDVTLLDSIEVDATSEQKDKLENALKYVEYARYDKAKDILDELMDAFDGRSYVVAYDYGVVNEATGEFKDAQELYQLADDLSTEPVEEINAALSRIDALIQKKEEATAQMEAGNR